MIPSLEQRASHSSMLWLVNTTDLMNYNTRSTGIGGPTSAGGKLYPGDAPGLGVKPDFDSLGAAVRVYS